jgi:hypothetical protein
MTDGPYRDGKPLDQLIEPDARRRRAAIFIGCGIVVGVVLVEIVRPLGTSPSPPVPTATTSPADTPDETIPVVGPVVAPPSSRPSLEADEVSRVVAAHRMQVRRRCWEAQTSSSSERVTLTLAVLPGGEVAAATAASTNTTLARCIEQQARSWTFPAHAEGATLNVPFVFTRE